MTAFLLGCVLSSALWYAYIHFTRAQPGHANTLVGSVLDGVGSLLDPLVQKVAAEIAKLPAVISAEVAQLRGQLAEWTARAQKAEAALADELAAKDARMNVLKDQLAATIAGVSASSPAAVTAQASAAEAAEPPAADRQDAPAVVPPAPPTSTTVISED